MRRAWTLCLALCFLGFPAQKGMDAGNWDAWRFLIGEWTAEGGGEPGQGTGTFSFSLELQGKILLRKNRSDYPATKDHPAYSHEDLMVIYPQPGEAATRAIYFDSEGHVIHYAAEFSEDKKALTFLSDAEPSAPRFRLTYTKDRDQALTIKFEIAPPGKPYSFTTYVEGIARRRKAR